jgi:UDP-glucose 4-epimerase
MGERRLAWVTGAHGFLGRHVARELSSTGWRVVGIGIGNWSGKDAQSWGLELWREAKIDLVALEELLTVTGRPELIFHAAGSGSVGFSQREPYIDFDSNVVTLAAVLETLRTRVSDAVVVYPSSAAVYGVAPKTPIPECAPLIPISLYGAHKLVAESLCHSWNRHFGVRTAIIRYFSLYGRGLRKQLFWELAQKIASNPEEIQLAGTGEERRDFLHVEDAARLVPLVFQQVIDRPVVINGGTGRSISVREVAGMMVALFGARGHLRFSREIRSGDPPEYEADVTQLVRIGFKPAWTLEAGLRDYIEWLGKSDLS